MNLARWSRFASLSVALTLCAAAAEAYTIYLKDGSRIVSREKYDVRDPHATALRRRRRRPVRRSHVDARRRVRKSIDAGAADDAERHHAFTA